MNKIKRRNAFFFFLEEKRSEMKTLNPTLTPRLNDVAKKIDADWQNMSPEEKRPYLEKAEEWNSQLPPPVVIPPKQKALSLEEQRQKNREDIRKYLEQFPFAPDMSEEPYRLCEFPIILAKFNSYWNGKDKSGITKAIPSEIGIVAFSFKKGIYDNYYSLIDPSSIRPDECAPLKPYQVNKHVIPHCKKLCIQPPGFLEEFQNYSRILADIREFWQKNTQTSKTYVFCLEEEMEVTKACFEWIFKRTIEEVDVKVLSFESLIQIISTEAQTRENRHLAYPKLRMAHREKELAVRFLMNYPTQYPRVKDEIFENEDQVAELLKLGNYSSYFELACLYHMQVQNDRGCRSCALLAVNRHAYTLLDVMTRNFYVWPTIGFHYPYVNDWAKEELERKVKLFYWTSNDCIKSANDYDIYEMEEEENAERLKKDRKLLDVSEPKKPQFCIKEFMRARRKFNSRDTGPIEEGGIVYDVPNRNGRLDKN